MTRGVARLGDTIEGICSGPGHDIELPTTGTIITASSDIQANNRGIARIGDRVQLDCDPDHFGIIDEGSSDTSSNNRVTARLGDRVVGDGIIFEGTIETASSDVFVN